MAAPHTPHLPAARQPPSSKPPSLLPHRAALRSHVAGQQAQAFPATLAPGHWAQGWGNDSSLSCLLSGSRVSRKMREFKLWQPFSRNMRSRGLVVLCRRAGARPQAKKAAGVPSTPCVCPCPGAPAATATHPAERASPALGMLTEWAPVLDRKSHVALRSLAALGLHRKGQAYQASLHPGRGRRAPACAAPEPCPRQIPFPTFQGQPGKHLHLCHLRKCRFL